MSSLASLMTFGVNTDVSAEAICQSVSSMRKPASGVIVPPTFTPEVTRSSPEKRTIRKFDSFRLKSVRTKRLSSLSGASIQPPATPLRSRPVKGTTLSNSWCS